MPVLKCTNHILDRLGDLRPYFNLRTDVDMRIEVMDHLLEYFDQLEEIRKKHNLKTIKDVFKGYETMQKEKEEFNMKEEVKNNKLDFALEKLSEVKASIEASKEDLSQKLKKLEDLEARLIPQHLKETNSKLDALTLKLTELHSPQQEPSEEEKELFRSLDEAMMSLPFMNESWARNLYASYKKLRDSKALIK